MHLLILLAKLAVESYIKSGKIIEPPKDLPEEFLGRKSGTFVTIKEEVRGLPRDEQQRVLRGCIGTYLPTKINIAQEIIDNAVAAATEDYRFNPIKEEELPYLSYTVYILSYPELVKDIKNLDPKKFGIIVKTGPFAFPNEKNVVFNGVVPYKTGLLLPDLEEVETIEQQISIACQKGGINPGEEKIIIYRFTVKKYQ